MDARPLAEEDGEVLDLDQAHVQTAHSGVAVEHRQRAARRSIRGRQLSRPRV
jgi:hypothetical protein